jgi:hypothetical protein
MKRGMTRTASEYVRATAAERQQELQEILKPVIIAVSSTLYTNLRPLLKSVRWCAHFGP